MRTRFRLAFLAALVTTALLSPEPVKSSECWEDMALTCYYSNDNTCFAGCGQGYCTLGTPTEEPYECENERIWCC